VVAAILPDAASVERRPAPRPTTPRLLARVTGEGQRRILLVGHLDTVVAHADHRPLRRDGDQLVGSGSIDMKGGDVLALGVLRALTETRRAEFAEVALLLVCDEEWRLGDFAHARRFAGWDACLCFEAGERDADDHDAVVVKRKAAGTVRRDRVGPLGPLGLGAPQGPQRAAGPRRGRAGRGGVPRPGRAGPSHRRADRPARGGRLQRRARPRRAHLRRARGPHERLRGRARRGARRGRRRHLRAENLRRWPGMDAREPVAPVLERAGRALGRPIGPASRGGASDASHFAAGSRSRSTGSGRSAAAPTPRTSSCGRPRCGAARRSRSRWRTPCCVPD
jgi:glutamate carboxypeptidase